MGNELGLSTGTNVLSPTNKRMNLSISAGGGYGQLNVLHSDPTAYGVGNIHFDTPLLGNTKFYEEVTVIGGKDALQGRYDAGVSFQNSKSTQFNVGAYASNDFNAPEFVVLDNPENLKLSSRTPIRQGLFQVGITAGVKHPVSKNVELFAKGDIANLSYSKTGECVYPVKSENNDYINNVFTRELKDEYNYQKGVGTSIGANVEGGTNVSFGNLTLTGKAGYSTFNGANFGVGATYKLNILNNKSVK